jgi:hypothetical protein
MSEEFSLDDIATKVCDYYRKLKKGSTEKKTVLFLKAITKYFEEWAQERDYTLRDFKSAISKIIQGRKHGKKFILSSENEEIEIIKGLNKKPFLQGSSCFSFTVNQVNDFNLNPETYF